MTKRKRGRRGLRVAFASAIAALGVSAVGVSSASAATMQFDTGFLKTGTLDSTQIIDDGTGPVQLNNVTYSGGTSGTFTVIPGDMVFPQFSGDVSGIPLTVQVTPLENVSGTLAPTGALTMNESDFRANITLGAPFNSDCDIEPIPLALSSADNSVFKGDLFDAGTNNPPLNGVVSDDWADLPNAQSNAGDCSFIDGVTGGKGGLWLANGVASPTLVTTEPPPPPGSNRNEAAYKVCVKKAQKAFKKAKKKAKSKKAKKKAAAKKKKTIKKCAAKFL